MRRFRLLLLCLIAALPAAPLLTGRDPVTATPIDRENPHFSEYFCDECHDRELTEEAGSWDERQRHFNAACLACHDAFSVSCRFHAGLEPGDWMFWTQDRDFPLLENKIYCLTCHDARLQCDLKDHAKANNNRSFLRNGATREKTQFCFACHRPERYRRYKVHGPRAEIPPSSGAQCLFCHQQIPDAGHRAGAFDLRAGPTDTCGICHALQNHPGGVDHLRPFKLLEEGARGSMLLRESGESSLQVQQGNTLRILPLGPCQTILCSTCHDPHGAGPGTFIFLLRLPEREALCLCCHRATIMETEE